MVKSEVIDRFIVFVLLSWIDAANTVAIARQGGPDVELNPVPRYFIAHYGPLTLYWYKAIFVVMILATISLIVRKQPASANRIMRAANWVMFAVCLWGGIQAYRL